MGDEVGNQGKAVYQSADLPVVDREAEREARLLELEKAVKELKEKKQDKPSV
jgi:hypothetical protein